MTKKVKVVEHYFTKKPKSKPRHGLIQVCLRGKTFEFLTSSGVFSTKRVDLGTRLLVENMILPGEGCALDVGCGYGVIGIAAAKFNPRLHVVMTDVNFRAVWLARQNVVRNGVSNVEVRRGHLYEPVENVLFDCVLSNPPVSAGMGTVRAMICDAPRHMRPKGTFQMVVKSKIAGKRFCSFFEDAFGEVEVLARGSGYRVLLSKNSRPKF